MKSRTLVRFSNLFRLGTGLILLVSLLVVLSPIPAFGQQSAGYALQFDGASDFVRLAETSSIMASGWEDTKTVSLWVKPTGTAVCTGPSPAACDVIFGDRARWWGISRGEIGGDDRIWLWNHDVNAEDMVGVEYIVDEWVHIALVHGGGTLRAYKNGVEVGSTASGTTQQPDTGAQPVLHIGGIINNSTRNWTFEGQIDEVRIWNTALDNATIHAWMYQELTNAHPKLEDLAAYYKMSDGLGSTLTDDSGNGWNGTLQDGGSGVPADGPITWVSSDAFAGSSGNSFPVADSQTVNTPEDTALGLTLTGSDPDTDPITFTVVSQPASGALSGMTPNLTYTPDTNFNGEDYFTFSAYDGIVNSSLATVTVTVDPVNDPPVAEDDPSANTGEDNAVTIDVLNNDDDTDGDTITVTIVGDAGNGTVVNNDADVSYTPTENFNGTDTFTYTISDGNGGSDTALVTVTVDPVNDPPVAEDDPSANTAEDTAVIIDVLSNDSDVDDDTLNITVVGVAGNGSVVNNGSDVTYTPTENFNGTDSFTYTISDGNGGSDTAQVTVTVDPAGAPPSTLIYLPFIVRP